MSIFDLHSYNLIMRSGKLQLNYYETGVLNVSLVIQIKGGYLL